MIKPVGQDGARNRRIILASRPVGAPRSDNFRLDEAPVPQPADGQLLLRTLYLSLDPYMRGRMSDAPSYAAPVGIGEAMPGGTVAASITAIPMGIDNVYLVKGERSIVVDGGQPGKFGPFARKLRQAGVSPSDIGLIVATHGHWDHIGCLAEMKQYTCAPLAMHAGDRNSIEAPNAVMPPGVTPWGRFLSALLSATVIPWLKIPAASVDVIVPDDGMSLEPYGVSGRVLHTPGHTPGSVSIVLPSGDALVGDLAMNRIPLRLSPGLPIFAEDMAQLKRSIEKLLAAGAKTIYPAHGKPFPANVLKSAVAAM